MAKTLLWITIILLTIAIGGAILYTVYISPISKSSITDAYRTQLDRLTPNYIEDKHTACIDKSGTWKESNKALGCFDLGEDWDSTWCESTEGSIVENICNGLGATWLCDQNNAGCEY